MFEDRNITIWVEPSTAAHCRAGAGDENFLENNDFLEEPFPFPISIRESQSTAVTLRYLYVANNGIAVLTASQLPFGVAAALQNPTFILRFRFMNDFKVILAPLWMRSGLSERESSSVCVDSIDLVRDRTRMGDFVSVDTAIKSKFSINFTTLSMTVVTWKNIVPRWNNPNEEHNITRQGMTFQLIIATDFLSTYLVTSYRKMTVSTRSSQAEYAHAFGPAVFKGKIEKTIRFQPEGK